METWIVAALCVVLPACSPELPPPGPSDSARVSDLDTASNPVQKALREAVGRLLQAIRSGDTKAFLALCSTEGIGVGADGWTARETLEKDFRARKESYCHYFDTLCLQKSLKDIGHKTPEDICGRLPLPLSYRDALNAASGVEVSHAEV